LQHKARKEQAQVQYLFVHKKTSTTNGTIMSHWSIRLHWVWVQKPLKMLTHSAFQDV